jgi:putative transposase
MKVFDYKGQPRYFITQCTFNKKPLFTDEHLVKWLVDVLKIKSENFGFRIWAYCFMPEYLHLLIEGKCPDSDMKQFISSYKEYTDFHYKQKTEAALWQNYFYNRILRDEEGTINVAEDIFSNPVRKGLIDDYKQYKLLGSFELDVKHCLSLTNKNVIIQ